MNCILHVLFRKWILFRQCGRGIPHVELASDDVSDQAGAVFAQQFDLAAGAVNSAIDARKFSSDR